MKPWRRWCVKWELDLWKMARITTDSNNTMIPCLGHNLHLAVGKAIGVGRVSTWLFQAPDNLVCLFQAFVSFPKWRGAWRRNRRPWSYRSKSSLTMSLCAGTPPLRWWTDSSAVCAVFAENWTKFHLTPKDSDMAKLETVREILCPLSGFTDALSGERDPTLSSVLPQKWKFFFLQQRIKNSFLWHERQNKNRLHSKIWKQTAGRCP